MNIKTDKRDGVTVIRCHGQFVDREASAVFKKAANELVDAGSPEFLVDLRDALSIDSSGLGEILAFCKRLREVDGRLKLLRPPADPDICAKAILEEYYDEEEALASFRE